MIYNLCILNTGKSTYRQTSHHSFSVPHESLCDPSLALEFDWQIHNNLCGSDHFPVILNEMMNPLVNTGKFNKADWLSFHTLCGSHLSDGLVLSEDPAAQFTDILIEIAKQNHPQIPCFQK